MCSTYEEYDDLDEREAERESSTEPSQDLPRPLNFKRPSKRRRTSNDSIDDFIDDCNSRSYGRSKRRYSTSMEDAMSIDEAEEKPKTKKSKYKIHIPKESTLPETTFQYGTQLPDDQDSSPYRIRGPKWKFPKKSVATGGPSKSTQFPGKVAEVRRQVSNTPPPSEEHPKFDIEQELAGLPSDAFSSSPEIPTANPGYQPTQKRVEPKLGFHQTTLFGGRAHEEEPAPTQINKLHNYKVDMVPEAPTHHQLDDEALKTWIYPTNLGTIREYQFNIVRQGLFSNMLVALPTGLGKTFIAATIMLNYFRWTKDAKIVFMAPTKPLVAQQVDACFNIAGIPRTATTMLTGEINPAIRAEEWQEKRVFFMTPQTLDNDLRTGAVDPKKIVLLVVDEAHRATGKYSYVRVVSFMRRFSNSFRILALTATPGSSVETVQEVIDGLEISKVEIRTEASMDIQQFTHQRKIEQILLDPSDEIIMVKDLFSKALQPLVDQLCGQNAYWNKDPMSLTTFGLVKAQQSWFMSDAGRRANPGLKGMMKGLFSILSSLAHAIKMLNYHGIGPFFGNMVDFRQGVESSGQKAGKYRKQINDNPHFRKMMDRVQGWINNRDFVGHPKLTYLCDTILNHFLDAGEGRRGNDAPPSSTQVIVFAEYRDSAEEICRVLNRHAPMIRASVFVGQADSKRSEGMNQKTQMDTIKKFKSGVFNVIVATSIGEEGLDIGQVDLIVCYDASGSPIRMLQRMGRTGRKRAGNIVLLLMRGKEEESFAKAKDNYEQMQKMIASGTRFTLCHDLSTRIVPKDISPKVDKKHIEIPLENAQDQSLPEPTRRSAKSTKRAPKKFNMPDGVETGFRRASKLVMDRYSSEKDDAAPLETAEEELMQAPAMEAVLLTPAELEDLERSYQNVGGDDLQEVGLPEMTRQPEFQRSLGQYKHVQHGRATKRFVDMIKAMCRMDDCTTDRWQQIHRDKDSSGERDLLSPSCTHQSAISTAASSPTLLEMGSQSHLRRRQMHPPRSRTNRLEGSTPSKSEECSSSHRSSGDDESLDDFVVQERAPLHGRITFEKRSSSPPDLRPANIKPFFEPTEFAPTQETNDDENMPEIPNLLGRQSMQKPRAPLTQRLADNNAWPTNDARGKRRRIVDEDSDE